MSSYSTMKRSLEVEVISAQGLKVDRKPLKKKTFTVVSIDDKHSWKSNLDDLGGSCPVWKYKFDIEMPINGSVRFISVDVFYRTSNGAEKLVGHAKIPVTDFMGGFAPQGHLNFLSYRLRDDYGDKCGIINVSIMVKPDGSYNDHKSILPLPSSSFAACSSQAAAATNNQMWRQRTSMASTAGYGGGRVVTGVPVWCAYQRPS
ncbi:PREDICTED: BON1-associated protein 2-like isoform X1 [Camelina sativa]|uniref:BON1-associated protein 2-like isoform X1 n=1 Tax=Camelina sativa TaxID=90675 RepID=A0ABM0YVP0_CAMSA|nr:PREDICTED: BON1-associated protein 2-like isoform X1 [Camelina sativa]